MIEAKQLSTISDRLKLAKNNNNDFGAMKIVLCGDPRQLPPVGGKNLWSKTSQNDSRLCIDGILLYRSFTTVCELTVSQRQAANSEFGLLCDRLGEAQLTESDYNLLNSLNA